MRSVTLPAVFLALLTAASAADAQSIRLGRNFKPHPFRTKEIRLKTESVYIQDLGYRKCGSSNTTRRPALTWTFTESMPDLVVRVENKNGGPAYQNFVIALPNGRFLCSQKGSQVYFKNWPKGTYKMWMFSPSIGVGGVVAFESPSRSKGAVTDALAKLPTVDLSAPGPNPRFTRLRPTRAASSQDVGIGCGAKATDLLMPLARLKTSRESTYFVDVAKLDTFIVTADNKCGGRETRLSPGVHTLWLKLGPKQRASEMTLETDDRELPRAFAARPVRQVGGLSEPMIIDGKVRAAQWWGSRRGNCGGAARAPDFYLESKKPLQKVTMSLLWSRKAQYLHVFGPLAEAKKHSSPRCSERGYRVNNTHRFEIFEGTYAVWVGDNRQNDGVGGDYHVLLRRDDAVIDPLRALAEIPAELEIAERAYMNHYPFFSGSPKNWELLFTRAPRQLFVFARVDIDGRKENVRAGEPLLVSSAGRDSTSVRRHDGSSAQIKNKLLTTAWPDSVWLPSKPTFEAINTVSTAVRYAGPEDQKAIDAYGKVNGRYTRCFGNYMAKHDPTWGKDHDVYRIRGKRVVNVSDQVAKRADRKCGARRVTRAEKKLLRTLNGTRKKRLSGHLAAVRARFGL